MVCRNGSKTNPDGSPYYSLVQPSWYPESRLLIHYFNDRSKTEGNLQPLITSQVTVKYKGHLYDGYGFDSTTVASDSVRTFLLAETIVGWQVALTQMHVGDSCEIIVPYTMGYGYMGNTSSTGVVTIPLLSPAVQHRPQGHTRLRNSLKRNQTIKTSGVPEPEI